MKARTTTLVAAATLALIVPTSALWAQSRQQPIERARAMSGTSAVVAAGADTIVAWLDDNAERRRVLAASIDGRESVALGPGDVGDDGAPATVATEDGSVWVIASRARGAQQSLWLQRRTPGGWEAAIAGPKARPFDHHPALAAGNDNSLWAVWLGDESRDADATTLFASQWDGSTWSTPEPLPRAVGVPMAPTIAVTSSGTPTVVWAANDGTDAEIWSSARVGGGWSSPRALTRNQVPDIMPSVAATPGGLLATWITYHDDGYRPVAATAADIDSWSAPAAISDVPGSRARAAVVDGKPAVFWRRLEFAPAGGTITSRSLGNGNWGDSVDIASASGSPFAVTSTADGGVLLAFSQPDGRLGVLDATNERDGDGLERLAATSRARYGAVTIDADPVVAPAVDPPTVPNNYTAFGDSITNGVVYDPDRRTSGGYRDPLQEMIRAFFRVGTIFNAGVDGEPTADGVGRIDNAIRAQEPQVILIMEGTNDIVAVVEVDTIAFNLRRMVQRSYEESPTIMPFLAQIPPRLDPGPEGFEGPGNGRIDELNSMLPEIGEQEGAVVVDQNTPLEADRSLMSNPLHPSIAGYEVMAEQWFAAIQPAVLDSTNKGDIDGSGRVDGVDLVRLALAFGALLGEDRYDPPADINGDGIIDGFDLDLLIEFFGTDTSAEEEGGS